MKTKTGMYIVRLSPAVALILLMYFFWAINPISAGPMGILIIFSLLYLVVAALFYYLYGIIGYFVKKIKPEHVISKRKIYITSSIVAFGPILLLALNSLGQLTFEDFILVVMLIGIALFYFLRRY